MPEPLDYENPKPQPAAIPRPAEGSTEPEVLVAVPAEFDHCLTRSNDHAGIVAVESALRARRIAFFRADGGGIAKRMLALYIRSEDAPTAAPIAAQIFARREKLRSFPRQRIPPDEPPSITPLRGLL